MPARWHGHAGVQPGSAQTGWSLSGGAYTITAADFVSRYKSHVVIIKNNINDAKIKITGSAGSSQTITSTIQILPVGAGLSTQQVKNIEIVGPGITLQPVNGLAILSGQGKVLLESGANVGSPGNGALIYLPIAQAAKITRGRGSGNVFEVEGDGTVYSVLLWWPSPSRLSSRRVIVVSMGISCSHTTAAISPSFRRLVELRRRWDDGIQGELRQGIDVNNKSN